MGLKNLPFKNLAVFILFFGLALIEAIIAHHWPEAGVFLVLGVLSLWADFRKI